VSGFCFIPLRDELAQKLHRHLKRLLSLFYPLTSSRGASRASAAAGSCSGLLSRPRDADHRRGVSSGCKISPLQRLVKVDRCQVRWVVLKKAGDTSSSLWCFGQSLVVENKAIEERRGNKML